MKNWSRKCYLNYLLKDEEAGKSMSRFQMGGIVRDILQKIKTWEQNGKQ